MAVRLVCKACGKRLKLPDGAARARSAKCPKCMAPIDLAAALEASAYLPTVAISKPGGVALAPKPAALIGEEDPLPYLPAEPPKPAKPAAPVTKTAEAQKPTAPAPKPEPLPLDDAPLSLDDDPAPEGAPPEPEPPFRMPVLVLADSARQIVGACSAVFVPHGLFLEHEPMQPFLYVPVGCPAEVPAPGEVLIVLPDARAVTVRFAGRAARPLARDARAFLAGERPAPAAAEYRRKWWMLWAALIFGLGLAVGPLALTRITELNRDLALHVGAVFAGLGLLANVAVVLFSRRAVPGQLVTMACAGAVGTGVFLFGATAYLLGIKTGTDAARASVEQPQAQTPVPPDHPTPGPTPPDPARPPSHVDRARAKGVSVLEDGPAEVTALGLAADNNALAIGYLDGTTRVWPLDQPTFDAMQPGPKADGPVTRIQFDSSSRFLFATTTYGVVAAPRGGVVMSPAKIPGGPVAVAPDLASERVRFAAVRGNTIQHRFLATTFIANPPKKDKDKTAFTFPGKGDEVTPGASAPDPGKPNGAAGPTFLAWGAGNRLFAGLNDGAIAIWTDTMRPEPQSRDHKATVKAWARAGTGDFATGDEQGNVGVWSAKGGKPTVSSVLATPITALAFAPSGARLAVADGTGWLVIWDVATNKALHRVKRPAPVRAVAFGPADDVVILGARNTVEVWSVAELVK
ncbi:MAG: WD40 repeat domain-containing protein [Planctomycetes bacterium]|nr:WD40 repeat domain-containing protein [Planctomycetota bacterium]